MTNLQRSLRCRPHCRHDVIVIRNETDRLRRFSCLEAETLWERFSESMAAGWLDVTEDTLKLFEEWLCKESDV